MYNSYDHKSPPPPPPSAPPPPPPGAPSYGYQPPQPQPPPYGHYSAIGIPITAQPTGSSSWNTGLCDCCSDVPNCCVTCWCPCITFGQIAEIADRGASSCGVQGALYSVLCLFTGCGCIYSCLYRSKVRQQYMLPETPCNDCCVHCCCESCALCQEYRELQHRGFDMSIGWQGNMARQSQGIVMPPVAPAGMSR